MNKIGLMIRKATMAYLYQVGAFPRKLAAIA